VGADAVTPMGQSTVAAAESRAGAPFQVATRTRNPRPTASTAVANRGDSTRPFASVARPGTMVRQVPSTSRRWSDTSRPFRAGVVVATADALRVDSLFVTWSATAWLTVRRTTLGVVRRGRTLP